MQTENSAWHTRFPPGFSADDERWRDFAEQVLDTMGPLADILDAAAQDANPDLIVRAIGAAVYAAHTMFHQLFPLRLEHIAVPSASAGDECSICWSTMDDPAWMRLQTCSHSFHRSCLTEWLTTKKEEFVCPVCRAAPHGADDK
jgi:hypothetical protein